MPKRNEDEDIAVARLFYVPPPKKTKGKGNGKGASAKKSKKGWTVSDFMLYCLLDPSSNEMMQGAYPACFLRELRTDL